MTCSYTEISAWELFKMEVSDCKITSLAPESYWQMERIFFLPLNAETPTLVWLHFKKSCTIRKRQVASTRRPHNKRVSAWGEVENSCKPHTILLSGGKFTLATYYCLQCGAFIWQDWIWLKTWTKMTPLDWKPVVCIPVSYYWFKNHQ